jgi:dTDP-4-amino-4,6-dideoxygalactose transaminase
MSTKSSTLALNGGQRAVTQQLPPMYPGGMRIGDEEEAEVLEVLRSKRLFRYYGPSRGESKVAQFEAAFARTVGVPHAAAVSSGTAALMSALAGLGVGPGDEVIVPAYTWIATASAAVAMGAVPIIAEVDESLTLDPADVGRKITPRTKAIMAVHMRGAPCDLDALLAVARPRGVAVVEDVAQAAGASYRGRRLGSIGDAGAFSLQFNKIITAGEGGVLTTASDAIHQRVLMYNDVVGGLRNGLPPDQVLPGINLRMGELQGAVALAQLRRLDDLLLAMRRNKAAIKGAVAEQAAAKGVSFRAIRDEAGEAAIALVLFMRTPEQARFAAEALSAEGAGADVLYDPDDVDYHIYPHWAPIMHQRAWSSEGGPWRWHAGDVRYEPDMCPRSLDLLGRAVHLNISPDLSAAQVEEVAEALSKVLEAI